jgi:biopolymer transport protein ExbD
MQETGALSLEARDAHLPENLAKLSIQPVEGRPDFKAFSQMIEQMKVAEPQITTALIQPVANSNYEDIIGVMDQLKRFGLTDLGVSPL